MGGSHRCCPGYRQGELSIASYQAILSALQYPCSPHVTTHDDYACAVLCWEASTHCIAEMWSAVMGVVNSLHCCWSVQVAVRSEEPYRIHCYSILRWLAASDYAAGKDTLGQSLQMQMQAQHLLFSLLALLACTSQACGEFWAKQQPLKCCVQVWLRLWHQRSGSWTWSTPPASRWR